MGLYKKKPKKLLSELSKKIFTISPEDFEQIAVDLLICMGYGVKGEVTKYKGDGGIDGIIKEDVLGLGCIVVQAKRYAKDNNVGTRAIRDFVGGMAAKYQKGVFITTSYFTDDAKTYVAGLNSPKITLINGDELVEYMYEYGLGLKENKTLKVMQIDEDFWDEMKDESNK